MPEIDRRPHFFLELTCATDGRTHRVDEVLLARGADVAGRIEASCGRRIVAASMAEPPGRPCLLCAAAVSAVGGASHRAG